VTDAASRSALKDEVVYCLLLLPLLQIQTLTKVSGSRDMWEIQFDLDKQIEKYNISQDPDFKGEDAICH
jgi:hypothetical protein